jgi:hypothetical protein
MHMGLISSISDQGKEISLSTSQATDSKVEHECIANAKAP